MAILIHTADPPGLLTKIRETIRNRQIDTWEMDSEGDLTHSPTQWRYLAWLLPNPSSEVLAFGIFGNPEAGTGKSVYGAYHGRFIEMLLLHFPEEFSEATVTAPGVSAADFFQTA